MGIVYEFRSSEGRKSGGGDQPDLRRFFANPRQPSVENIGDLEGRPLEPHARPEADFKIFRIDLPAGDSFYRTQRFDCMT